MDELAEQRRNSLQEALTQILHEFPEHPSHRGLLTGWTVIVETVGDDGEPYLQSFNSQVGYWRIIGMLEVAKADLLDVLGETDED